MLPLLHHTAHDRRTTAADRSSQAEQAPSVDRRAHPVQILIAEPAEDHMRLDADSYSDRRAEEDRPRPDRTPTIPTTHGKQSPRRELGKFGARGFESSEEDDR